MHIYIIEIFKLSIQKTQNHIVDATEYKIWIKNDNSIAL